MITNIIVLFVVVAYAGLFWYRICWVLTWINIA